MTTQRRDRPANGRWCVLAVLAVLATGCGTSPAADDASAQPPDLAMSSATDLAAPPDLSRVDLGPCGGPCSGDTPYCDARAGRCVSCRDDRDCGPGTLCHGGACVPGCNVQRGCGDAGVCERDAGLCVECIDDGDCARLGDPRRAVCDFARGRCIACRAAPDTCPAQQYCRVEMGAAECVAGCKTSFDCPVPDGGGQLSCCNHGCVDTGTSKAHCGQCGVDCGPDPDAACCASKCVRTGSDVGSCGACGRACAFANAAATCNAGACKLGACNPGFENCNADPVDGCEIAIASDIRHCGACGRACSVPNGVPGCLAGACALASCNAGYKNCDGMLANGCETHVAVDPDNCGTCGSVCGKVPHAAAGCMNSACVVISCDAGFGNCDKQDNNGCETDVTSTLAHCGACGNACPQPANVIAKCTGGMCMKGGCVQGYSDCDNNANNGCEAQLASDINNCGACGKPCLGGGQNAVAACVNGACSFACNVGFGDCDGNQGNGCEAKLVSDNLNCGACGKACPNNQSCIGGVCTDTVLSFDFEENGGNQVLDGSPQHNNGTLAGNFMRVAGKVGNAIKFDGTSYITVPDAPSLSPSNITIEMWVKFDNCNGIQDMMGKDLWDQQGGRQYLLNQVSGHFRAHALVNNVFNYIDGATPCVPNVWTHVAETYDGTTLILYVNGKLDIQKVYGGPLQGTNTTFTVAQQASGSYRVFGTIDSVRVFPYARSANDIANDAK